ncbi:MAG: serine/threonine protein kinase [Betaproteobacteria bacterium]|nr:serine/threonine protein kinase [Betaproteobacteria bacterium]
MASQSTDPLAPGTRLGEYVIDRQIGGGGFSLVYLAYDMESQPVAIKEYMPGGVVTRDGLGTVHPLSEDKNASFRYGMKCFFEEGRALAGIQHPNVIRVSNFFRANDTVYMVMKYELGRTLQKHITATQEPLREPFIRSVFVQLLNGLREVHTNRILHLDIKPSNIYLRTDGSPVLLDFGAARNALNQDLQFASTMYTPGFAPPEVYSQRERLGPWTDIYSVGASMYACITRNPPPAADARMKRDALNLMTKSHGGEYSTALLELIDHMLRLNYTERPQSVFTVQKRLIEMTPAPKPDKPSLFGLIKERLRS